MIKKEEPYNSKGLTVTEQIRVRFNETDPLGIVWHGHYIAYFEDGREAFGRQHGISYLTVFENGFATPIVKSSCEHKLSLKYGDIITIETTFVNSDAAKMIFKFKIFDAKNQVVCTGETVQVFIDSKGELVLNNPPFFEEWKKKMGLLND
jgi:acyl-CoA thioester hydrolase